MNSQPLNFPDEHASQHLRRIRWMLWVGAGLLTAMGALWLILFSLRGAWLLTGIDFLIICVGVGAGLLNYTRHSRSAFYLMFVRSLLVIVGISLFFDIPSDNAPRTTHLFLLPLALASELFMRSEPTRNRVLVFGGNTVQKFLIH